MTHVKLHQTVSTHPVADYVRNKYIRLYQFVYIIRSGVAFYRDLDGREYTEEEMNKKYPLKTIIGMKDNPDKTKRWME